MTSIAREPLTTPSTWLDPELLRSDDWVRRTPGQIIDLENALAVAKATRKPMTELTRDEWADSDAFVQQGIPVKRGVASNAEAFAVEEVRS